MGNTVFKTGPPEPRVQLDLYWGRPSDAGADAHLVDRLRKERIAWWGHTLETFYDKVQKK